MTSTQDWQIWRPCMHPCVSANPTPPTHAQRPCMPTAFSFPDKILRMRRSRKGEKGAWTLEWPHEGLPTCSLVLTRSRLLIRVADVQGAHRKQRDEVGATGGEQREVAAPTCSRVLTTSRPLVSVADVHPAATALAVCTPKTSPGVWPPARARSPRHRFTCTQTPCTLNPEPNLPTLTPKMAP